MLSEIGSWRRHENSGRFVGSSRVKNEEADKPILGQVVDTGKHYAVTVDLSRTEPHIDGWRDGSQWRKADRQQAWAATLPGCSRQWVSGPSHRNVHTTERRTP